MFLYIDKGCGSLPADVLWGSFVTHSFLPHVTNEPQRTSAGRLGVRLIFRLSFNILTHSKTFGLPGEFYKISLKRMLSMVVKCKEK